MIKGVDSSFPRKEGKPAEILLVYKKRKVIGWEIECEKFVVSGFFLGEKKENTNKRLRNMLL